MSDDMEIKNEPFEKFKKLHDESLLKLTEEERNSICQNLSPNRLNPYWDTQLFIKDALFRATNLPERILRKLITFRMSKNDDGVLLIEGLPDEPILPSTPTTPDEKASKTTFVSEEILAMFGLFLGEPFGYAEEKNGALFQDIFPTRQGSQIQSNESSEVDLKLHSEDAPEKYRPDYVLLYCIKNGSENDAVTFISLAKDITDKLTDCEFEQLKKKRFYPTKLPSFGGNITSEKLESCAVIEGSKASPSIRYDCFMNGDTDMDNKLLGMIDKFGELVKKPIKLKSGSLLIIDNNRALHSRSKFTAKLQGEDRLLQRLNVKKDLRIAREYIPPDSQIIRML